MSGRSIRCRAGQGPAAITTFLPRSLDFLDGPSHSSHVLVWQFEAATRHCVHDSVEETALLPTPDFTPAVPPFTGSYTTSRALCTWRLGSRAPAQTSTLSAAPACSRTHDQILRLLFLRSSVLPYPQFHNLATCLAIFIHVRFCGLQQGMPNSRHEMQSDPRRMNSPISKGLIRDCAKHGDRFAWRIINTSRQ